MSRVYFSYFWCLYTYSSKFIGLPTRNDMCKLSDNCYATEICPIDDIMELVHVCVISCNCTQIRQRIITILDLSCTAAFIQNLKKQMNKRYLHSEPFKNYFERTCYR